MIVQHLNRDNTICFFQFDSLNQFNNRAPYALSNTPLYTPHTDSWQKIRTIRQTELECGTRVCLTASLIAQHTGTLQSRVNKCKDIINLSNFTMHYMLSTSSQQSNGLR
jgi:hypothetical protein